MTETTQQILESSFRIAWDYLQGTGGLGKPEPAARFLLDHIATAMSRGEYRRLLLSNHAIDAYRRVQAARDLALVS